MTGKETERWIAEAEQKWLSWLEQQCALLFRSTFLPSHDQTHHRRVWNHARKILMELAGISNHVTSGLVEGLLCAAWFHDTGMARDRGPSHGIQGKLMLGSALREWGKDPPARLEEVMHAIEHHDNKEKLEYRVLDADRAPRILDLLSVADDADALGVTGVYRYVEIYLHRGIPLKDLGTRILENAWHRFRNVARCCRNCPDALAGLSEGHRFLSRFFDLYNQQLVTCSDPAGCPEGPLGAVNHIRRECLPGRIRPEELHRSVDPSVSGRTAYRYFLDLKNELEHEQVFGGSGHGRTGTGSS